MLEPHPDFDPDELPPWESGPRLTYRRAATIAPTKPGWHWMPWLPIGALVLLVGRQGLGKTTLAAYVVGNLSSGRGFPDDPETRDPATCAILSLEEPAERLVARLHAIGADIERVLIVGEVEDTDEDGRKFRRPWRLPNDCTVLEQLLEEQGIAFLTVDGLGYSVAGDSHNYGNVGSALSALAAVAERTGCTILGLTHPPKGAADPITAAIGSTAWTAIARVVWLLGCDPEDETGARRVVRVSKSNFKLPENGLAFVIDDDERLDCGFVTGLRSSTVTAEDLVAASMPPGERTQREEAREMVRSILKAGPMETAELLATTRKAGVSDRTVDRARQDLGVKATPRHDPVTGKMIGWLLSLTDRATPPPSLPGSVGGVGGVVVTSSFSPSFSDQSAQSATPPTGGLVESDGVPFFDRDEF